MTSEEAHGYGDCGQVDSCAACLLSDRNRLRARLTELSLRHEREMKSRLAVWHQQEQQLVDLRIENKRITEEVERLKPWVQHDPACNSRFCRLCSVYLWIQKDCIRNHKLVPISESVQHEAADCNCGLAAAIAELSALDT